MADALGNASTLTEEQRSTSHQAISPTTPHSVDVTKAEQEFNALARQLTQHSQAGPTLHKSESTATTRTASDPEKGGDEAPFDLREYLTSSNDAQQQAGIKAGIVFYALYYLITFLSISTKYARVLPTRLKPC